MSWGFSTDPEYQALLDWTDRFVREEVEPLDLVAGSPWDKADERSLALARPLQQQVKEQGLWACHLGPELGGPGYGQLKLALLNEVLGRSRWAPAIFGCQAPDSGNAEILAHYGTPEQRSRFLEPLLAGEVSSCYSMTEPQGGSDPAMFTTTAHRDGDEWVINGTKWFSSNARYAAFFIVMAFTDANAGPYNGMSMFLVPAGTPGLRIVRDVGLPTEAPEEASHALVSYEDVRIPTDHLLGQEGGAFAVAQTRLGGGRIHHAMRTIAQVRRAFDSICARAVSRRVRSGGTLGSLQLVQDQIADAWIELEQFRLLVLQTAWRIDQLQDYRKVRRDIAAVKAAMPEVYTRAVRRALHLHGALGVSSDMPFVAMLVDAEVMGLADGPTEVHKLTVARETLKGFTPEDELWPSEHLPTRRAAANAKIAGLIDRQAAEV